MARYWMGELLEQTVKELALDREQFITFIWRCPCRDRQRRYVEASEWAEAYRAEAYGVQGSSVAIARAREAWNALYEDRRAAAAAKRAKLRSR